MKRNEAMVEIPGWLIGAVLLAATVYWGWHLMMFLIGGER